MPHPASALLCACLCAGVCAQAAVDSKSSGPLMGVPHALSVGGTTCALGGAENWIKASGVTTALPTPPPAGGGPVPDYRIASIVGAAVAPLIDIDAISIGLDLIHADPGGVLQPPPPPRLALLSFSVTPATQGASGPVQAEATAADGNAADLFSYWVQAGGREAVDLAVDATESRIHCGPQRGNMDAHDLYLSLYATAGGTWLVAMLQQMEQAFYFSVTNATVAACPAAWWNGTTPSGATVLYTTWTGAGWTPIRPFVTHAQLGLPASADLDAVAVAPQFGFEPTRWMLYSTTTALPDPVMIYGVLPARGPFVYQVATSSGPVPVSRRFGLRGGGSDDVDAICALDPGFPGPPPLWLFPAGSPQASSITGWLPLATGAITLGGHRRSAAPAGFQFLLKGCPPAGCLAPGVGVLLFHLPGSPLPITTFVLGVPAGMNLLQLTVPFTQPTPALGAALDVYWTRWGGSLPATDGSYALRMNF